MILLAILHIAGCLTVFSYLVDHYPLERIEQVFLFALIAFGWPAVAAVRLAQVAVREYRALRGHA